VRTCPKQRFFINRNAKITEGNAILEQLKYLILVGFRKPDIAIAHHDEKVVFETKSKNEVAKDICNEILKLVL
jgi:small-conductance mechanosensitive channel